MFTYKYLRYILVLVCVAALLPTGTLAAALTTALPAPPSIL